ncbi:MAG: peptide chain release factor 2 [Candidatus Omnitrophica bacterium]|nr:peptide chain release factor 2 [Candidatus Omnitrophota bacterium]MCM8827135.1 peptide chain release factor 2 [Candidatus Omnitrophota bacterium]
MFEDIVRKLDTIDNDFRELKSLLRIEDKRREIDSLQLKMGEASFWDNPKMVNEVVSRVKQLKEDVETSEILEKKIEDVKDMINVLDSSYQGQLLKEVNEIENLLDSFKMRVFLNGQFDEANAIVEINSGAGGTEACDWAQMLFRMYLRWAEEKRFDVKVVNEVRGEEVGFKNISFFVEGRYAYGFLKSEKGVHRLVRISPFDANKRRHTSFASVDVVPEVEDISMEIKQEDLKIETYRASGHGGQHVNVTDSAVRITHIPTGIVVSCQNERSQYQNKQTALRVLRAKIYEHKREEQKKSLEKLSGDKKKIEWGSQIRSYVLFPYLLVKDHRTDFEDTDAKGVLDGKLDGFILSYLKYNLNELDASKR